MSCKLRHVRIFHLLASLFWQINKLTNHDTFTTCLVLRYYCYKRTVIPDGYFGHFVSSGQHKLVRSGIHSLISCTDKWLDKFEVEHAQFLPLAPNAVRSAHTLLCLFDMAMSVSTLTFFSLDSIQVDGEDKKIRVLGSKIFLTVPENHIGSTLVCFFVVSRRRSDACCASGGGFRIGMKNGNEDGTFVLFNQGWLASFL